MQHQFGSIGAYREWRRRRSNIRFWCVVCLAWTVPILFPILHKLSPRVSQPTTGAVSGTFVYQEGSGILFKSGTPIDDWPATGKSLAEANRALDVAVVAWRLALHDPSLETPKLTRGFCGDRWASACASSQQNEIEFTGKLKGPDGTYADLPTVFMHEIGHILGVPHMDGDPLMDPVYRGKLTAPSVDAVAVAKAHRRGKP
jgi:hypothetical protein